MYARDSEYLQMRWPVNDKPLNTFGRLELLFPIFKNKFVLVLNTRKCINTQSA